MKNKLFQPRQNAKRAFVAIVAALVASAIVAGSCSFGMKDGLNGTDGKDGIDGKDATAIISDDGELIVNGNPTGVAANREDCEIVLNIDGEEFGKVIGGGKFTAGQTVAIQAVPFKGSCFKGWKNKDGEIVSLDKTYVFVAEKGKTEFTALFEKSLIEVYFITGDCYSDFGGDFLLEINGEKHELKDTRDLYGHLYHETNSPAVFDYGDEVNIKISNFKTTSFSYHAYIYELSEAQYNGKTMSSGTSHDVTDDFEYSFEITENKKYYFSFSLEFNIFIEIVQSVSVAPNNPLFGDAKNTECKQKGDEVTLTATVNDSKTTDYIYDFAGWYLNGELFSENKIHTFNATENNYEFTAKFIKKYALKIGVSIYDKEVFEGQNISGDAYKVKYKKLTVISADKSGKINTVTFNGNYNSAAETDVKICGYFEAGEKIYLSYDIESAHDSYYEIDERDGEKTYKEKFVYGTWQIVKDGKDAENFLQGSAGTYMINEADSLKSRLNIMLQVILYGDKIRG